MVYASAGGTFESESEGIHRPQRRTVACPRLVVCGGIWRATNGSGRGGEQRVAHARSRGGGPSRVARRSGLRFGSRRPTASRSAGYRLQRIEGRWIDGVRLLDLLGRFKPRRREQSEHAPVQRLSRAWVGLRLAERSAYHI